MLRKRRTSQPGPPDMRPFKRPAAHLKRGVGLVEYAWMGSLSRGHSPCWLQATPPKGYQLKTEKTHTHTHIFTPARPPTYPPTHPPKHTRPPATAPKDWQAYSEVVALRTNPGSIGRSAWRLTRGRFSLFFFVGSVLPPPPPPPGPFFFGFLRRASNDARFRRGGSRGYSGFC